MRSRMTIWALVIAIFVAPLLGLPRPAVAQDARWGLLAEVAERDLQFDASFGIKSLFAFRWEEPGRRMSLIIASGPFSQKTLYSLDPASGEIVVVVEGANGSGARLSAAPDGTLRFVSNPELPYLESIGDGKVRLNPGYILYPTPSDSPATRRASKLIDAGKLRAADTGLRAPTGPSSVVATANTTRQKSATSSPVGPALVLPDPEPLGADMSQVQRDALDRWVNSAVFTPLSADVPGHGKQGTSLRAANWTVPGKAFVVHTLHDLAGESEKRYTVRSDGVLALDPQNDFQRSLGLTGHVYSDGKITLDWHIGPKQYRSVILAWPGYPAGIQVINYENVAKLNQPAQWSELYKEHGMPTPPDALAKSRQMVKALGAMKASPWGAMSLLPGTLWYCVGYEPQQWLMRRRVYHHEVGLFDESVPVMRLTVATWREPGRSLEVITKLGDGRGWIDLITLQADGSFTMATTGVSQNANLKGQKLEYGRVVFPVARYNYHGGVLQNTIEFSTGPYDPLAPRMRLHANNFNEDAPSCDMKPFDKEKLPEWTAELTKEQRDVGDRIQGRLRARDEFAADRAAGQQMLAGMQADLLGAIVGGGGSGPVAYSPQSARTVDGAGASPFLHELQQMADIAHRDAEASRQQLESTIAQAGRSNSTAPGGTGSTDSASDSNHAAGSSDGSPASPSAGGPASVATQKSARAYFVVGMTPTAANTRNPMCYSTAFEIQFKHEANGWGDNGRAQEALKALESRFVEQCSRHGQVNGVVNGNVEGLTSGFPMGSPHAQDFVVPMP